MYYSELKGEKAFEYKGERWLYVHDIENNTNTYLHLNCDAPVDENGLCIMCGKASPLVQ